MLKLVRMEELGARRTSQISGGQQQRVALARALAPKPQVLLLDEPLSALDAKLRKDMQIELKRMQAETGITFIFVTHDQEEALTMSDRIAVMNKGHILQMGVPTEIYQRPANRFVANFIGETNFLRAAISGKAAKLAAGGELALTSGSSGKGDVTIVVRPEHATIGAVKKGALTGVAENVVYLGTDTHVHLKLSDGSRFVVRQQNIGHGVSSVETGKTYGIAITPGTAQVVAD